MFKKALIVAIDEEGGFGKDGHIPWYHKEDFDFFRKMTTYRNVVVMGRNTYDEINKKKLKGSDVAVLPGRECYVVSTTLSELPNATVVRSVDQVPHESFFVIGGKRLYDEALKFVDTAFITEVEGTHDCDVFFDTITLKRDFAMVDCEVAGPLTFKVYAREVN